MQKPCVVIELDPTNLEQGRTVLTAGLSLFHDDVEVVLTLSGVQQVTADHGDAVTRLCLEIADGSPLPDITLETVEEAAARTPLLSVKAVDDPSSVVEAIVLLSSIALKSWQAESTGVDPVVGADGDEKTEVAAWRAQRDAVIVQRDGLRPAGKAPGFAAVVTSVQDVLDVGGVLECIKSAGGQVDVVVAAAGEDTEAVRRAVRYSGRGTPRSAEWLARRFHDVTAGLAVVLYTHAGASAVPDSLGPVLAAEYGLRVAYLATSGVDVGGSVPPRNFDTAGQRVAWRIYAGTSRVEKLFENLRVGSDALRVTGSPLTDRARRLRGDAAGEPGRTTVLWMPTVWRRGGLSDLRLLAERMITLAEADPGLDVVVRPDGSAADMAKLGARDVHVQALREASERLHNLRWDESPDTAQALASADALVSGITGPIAEAIALDIPHLCVFRADSMAVPEGADYLMAGGLAEDGEGLEDFVRLVRDGVDPWRQTRAAVRRERFGSTGASSTETIADDLYFSLLLEEQQNAGSDALSRPTRLLSVAMIVKNEAENLPATLDAITALSGVIDEVCVYDTGSTDATVEIARHRGARVEQGYWDNDFARARNAAIDMCSSKWVLILDADEHVFGNVALLRRTLQQALTAGAAGIEAITVHVEDIDARGQVVNEWPSRRLLRPSRAHYVGHVHEDVYRRDGSIVQAVEIAADVVSVRHHGYADAELLEHKVRRNHAIADDKVASATEAGDTEQLIQALVDRARSAAGFGDIAAARKDFERVREMGSARAYRWWGMEQFAELLLNSGETEDAESVVALLEGEDDTSTMVAWLRARLLLAADRPEEAARILDGVEVLSDALGMRQQTVILLDTRMRAAVAAGRIDEAIASLVPMMTDHGFVHGYGPLLMTMWGARPPEVLAEFLSEGGGRHTHAIIDEVRAANAQGAQVAALLESLAGEVVA